MKYSHPSYVINFNNLTPSHGVMERADTGVGKLPVDKSHRKLAADRAKKDLRILAMFHVQAKRDRRRDKQRKEAQERWEFHYERKQAMLRSGGTLSSFRKANVYRKKHFSLPDHWQDGWPDDNYPFEDIDMVPESGTVKKVNNVLGAEYGNDVLAPDIEFVDLPMPKDYSKSATSRSMRSKREAKKKLPLKYRNFIPEGVDLDEECLEQLFRFDIWCNEQPTTDAKTQLFYKRIEDLVLTVIKLSLCTDWKLALLELISYVKTFTDKSLVSQAMAYIVAIFKMGHDIDMCGAISAYVGRHFGGDGNVVEGEIGQFPDVAFVPEMGTESFVDGCKLLLENFNLIKSNPIFKKISYILSACVTLGLCEATSLDWNIGGIKFFSPNMYQKHVSAPDLISAIFESLVYFVEGGRELFVNGDLSALLFSDKRIKEIQSEFNFLHANFIHIKTGNLEKFAGISQADYSTRLDKLIINISRIKTLSESYERAALIKLESKLFDMRAEFQVLRTAGGIKKAPIVISIHGASGQGKSTVSARLMIEIHVALGLSADPQYFAYYNTYDEYDSGLNGSITGIFFDELGNTKANMIKKVAYEFLMRANNNARATAVMAEVDLKGKISIEPDVIIITTNAKDLGAHDGSKEPVSVVRRADIHMHIRVKPEFQRGDGNTMIDPAKVALKYGDATPGSIEDVWFFHLEEAYGIPAAVANTPMNVLFRTLKDDEGELKDIGYKRALKYIVAFSKKKRKMQEDLVRRTNDFHNHVTLCPNCEQLSVLCECFENDDNPHNYSIGDDPLTTKIREYQKKSAIGRSPHLPPIVEEGGMVPMGKAGEIAFKYMRGRLFNAIRKTIDYRIFYLLWMDVDRYIAHSEFLIEQDHNERIKNITFATSMLIAVLVMVACWPLVYVLLVCFASFSYAYKVKIDYQKELNAMYSNTNIFINVAHRIRKARVAETLAVIGGLTAAYYGVKKFLALRSLFKTPQGNLMPTCAADIEVRDKEKNVWQKVKVTDLPVPCRENLTATPEQVVNTVWKNLVILTIDSEYGRRYCDALLLESNFLLMPYHMMYCGKGLDRRLQTNLKATFKRHGEDEVGGVFSCYIDNGNSYRIPDTDLLLVSVPNAGSYANIVRLLPDIQYNGNATFIYKQLDGTRRCEGATLKHALVGHTYATFDGYDTVLTNPTHNGLCMGVFVTTGKGPHIAGFHLGGTITKSNEGIAGFISKETYVAARDILSKKKGIFVPHSSGEFPTKILGVRVLDSTEVHSKSPVNFMSEASCMLVFGSCPGGTTFVSRVCKSLISDSVANIMGQPNIWGPPKTDFKWRPWHTTMDKFTHASEGFPHSDLAWACEDYVKPLSNIVRNNEYARNMIRPLTPVEVINGVPGERFIDKMNFSTSIGFPLTGPKSNYLVPIPGGVEGYDEAMTFTQEIWDEISRNESAWCKGERAYTPVKAVLKDEPTKVTKEKMRVFYSMAIGAQYHLRRLTLGLTRFIQMHPLISESMVGMNCVGPEWQQSIDYFIEGDFNPALYPDGNCFAGDYEAYDTRMPAQVMSAALRIYEDLLVESGNFSEKDIMIYRGVCSEILSPIVAFNGTLVQLFAGIISGHNLTVHINNLCNSLLKRVGFLNVELRPRGLYTQLTFRDCERGGNYGDDCKSAINRKKVLYWNMISYRDFLARYGIVFTMPDKNSEMIPYMQWRDAEFLKRTDSYVPELDCILGKLDELSIFKSLHSNIKSEVLSRTDHAAACMEGAAFEWFPYGREIYERRMEELRMVAKQHNIRVPGIMKTYDDRVTEWYATYKPGTLEITPCSRVEALGAGLIF